MLDHYGEEKVITFTDGSYVVTIKMALVNQFIDYSGAPAYDFKEYSSNMLHSLDSSTATSALLAGRSINYERNTPSSDYRQLSPQRGNMSGRFYSVLRFRFYVKYTGILKSKKIEASTLLRLYRTPYPSNLSVVDEMYYKKYVLQKDQDTLLREQFFCILNKVDADGLRFYYDYRLTDDNPILSITISQHEGAFTFYNDLLFNAATISDPEKSSEKFVYKDPDGTPGKELVPGIDSLYIEVPEISWPLQSEYYDYIFFLSRGKYIEKSGWTYHGTPVVFKNVPYETYLRNKTTYRKYNVPITEELIDLNGSNPLIDDEGNRYSYYLSWGVYSKIQQESQDRILYDSGRAKDSDAFEPGYALLSGTNFVNTYINSGLSNDQYPAGFYIKLPELMTPVLNEFGILPYNNSDFYTNYVSGYTRVRFVMSSEVPIDNTLRPEMWVKVTSPDNKETLYEIDNNGMPYSFPNGILLESSGDYTFTPILKLYSLFNEEYLDEKEIRYAWPYGPPQLRGFDCRRCDLDPQSGEYVLSDDGFNLMVNYSTEVSEIGDPNINGSEVTLKYKRCIDSSWSDEIKIPLDSSGRCIVPIASGSSVPAQFDKDSAFDISLKITDDFGTFAMYRDILSTTFDLINFGYGGKSFAFGKASDPKYNGQTEDPDDNPTLENAMNNVFYKDISMAYSRDAKKVGILGSIVSLLQFLKNILSTDYDCFRYLSNAESADAYDSNDKVGSYIVYKDPNSEDFTVSNLPSNSGPGVLLVMSPFYKTENPEYDDSHNPEHDSVIQVYINEVVTNGISLRSHNYIQEEDPDHPGQYIFRGQWTDWVSLF